MRCIPGGSPARGNDARLNGAIDRVAMSLERERVARYTVGLLLPEVKKLIQEEVKKARPKSKGENTA